MEHDIRQDQIREGRSRTLGVSGNRNANNLRPPKRAFVPKGHDAILHQLQAAGGNITIVTVGDGSEHYGKLIARDKYTITIEIDTGERLTFYKHAIESFKPESLETH